MGNNTKSYILFGCIVLALIACSCAFLSISSILILDEKSEPPVYNNSLCEGGELYDPVDGVCYIECFSEVECDTLQAEVDTKAGALDDTYFDDIEESNEVDIEEEVILVTYDIEGSQIANPIPRSVDEDSLIALRDDKVKHEELWKLFYELFPEETITNISQLEISTDGKDGTLAAVYQSSSNISEWILVLDIVDSYPNGRLDDKELTSTLIHEFGHLLTLSPSQIDYDENYFYARTDEQANKAYESGRASCPNYYTYEGCSYSYSYIDGFVDKFWTLILEENEEIESIQDEDEYYDALDEFYLKYSDLFVTDYAATNPGEDIAESWTAFILQNKPRGNSVPDQKILYFYEFPELVSMRALIRSNL